MNSATPQQNLVPLSHSLCVGQWDKSGFSGTSHGTTVGQTSLKALATKVLQRDKPWDKSGTSTRKCVGQDDEKQAVLSHSVPLENSSASSVCPGWWRNCFTCPEYRAGSILFCRKLHHWKPWPHPQTGEMPVVIIGRGGHVRHWYPEAGITRFVGVAQ